jgi:CRP/FNR family transcriptional regulator, cyclic AMP receptor protein
VNDHWHTPKVDWLRTLPAAPVKALRQASTVRTYEPGDPIFGPSRDPRQVYVLEDGLVRIFRVTPAGAEFTLGYVRPGELFGEVSVLSDKPRETFAQAKVASKILSIPRTVFLATLRAHNPVLYSVTKRIAERVIALQSRAEDLIFLDVRSRLVRLLVRLADEHGRRDDRGLAIGLPLTHDEIATLIGTSRQTVSLLLRELTDAGLVARRGRQLVLPKPAGLEAIARPADGRRRGSET